MLGWIFKRKGGEGESAATEAAPLAATPAPAAPSAPAVDGTAALAAARGDDEALLALALKAGVPLPTKLAAVEALGSEAALKQAEREFRGHDRRVHQLAKQQLQAVVAQRQAREQAARLIETARGLVAQAATEDVPVNRAVELDHAWQALDAAVLEPTQREDYAALSAQLTRLLRTRADTEQQRKRWLADAAAAQKQLQAAGTEAAAGTHDRARLAAAMSAARGVVAAAPEGEAPLPAVAQARAELQQTIDAAAALDEHLAVLDQWLALAPDAPSPGAGSPDREAQAPAPPAAQGDTPEAAPERAESAPPTTPLRDLQARWQALTPLPETPLAAPWAAQLQARLAHWQQAREQAKQARQTQRREQTRERQRALKGEQVTVMADRVTQAEAALDAGQLQDAHRHLNAIESQLQGAEPPAALQPRLAAAQARLSQLRGWKHWAGGRAREELVQQAEALAAATLAGAGQGAEGAEVLPEVARLSIRQRADVIDTLRKRWKEIEGGGPDAQAIWQRFDAALKTAGEPVATHVAAQRAAREANLAVRLQLLAALEAAVPAQAAEGESGPMDARAMASALDRFQGEWRKLGPLEHTVPRAAQAGLLARMQAAQRQLQTPLQAARASAAAQRQALVARARALADDAGHRGRHLADEVRALQAQWQQQAKALPLARADEQALWTEFKTAIDAAFAAREAVFSAREAEFEAHAAERVALIERLQPSPEDTPATVRRTLAEVEAAWQRCGPAPRARANALEADYRHARDALRRWLDDSAQRDWLARCDALDAKLALCRTREQGGAEGTAFDAEASAAAWAAMPAVPAPLEAALRRRIGLDKGQATGPAPDIDDLLLQIETAWELPTPPAFEAARRERKLLAMKASLEGRRSAAPEALPPAAALARLLGAGGLGAGQVQRLEAALGALRQRGPKGLQ